MSRWNSLRPVLFIGRLIGLLGIFFIIWDLIVTTNTLNEFFVPRPIRVMEAAFGIITTGKYSEHIFLTLQTFVLGLLLGSVFGLFIGFIIGGNWFLRSFFILYIFVIAAIPKILFYPIIFKIFVQPFWFKVAFVALHAFIFVIIGVVSTLKNLDASLIIMAKTYGCTGFRLYSKIFWPAVYFSLLASLRMAAISSLVGAIVADMLVAPGVGYVVNQLAYRFMASELYALIAVVASFAIAINFALLKIEKWSVKLLRI
jgi:ABC-type nitrate/sulfonate/bicarbonate transport system permease component